ncbi:Mam protein, partial [Gryllus bimaculatus]
MRLCGKVNELALQPPAFRTFCSPVQLLRSRFRAKKLPMSRKEEELNYQPFVSAGQHLQMSGELKPGVSVAAQQGMYFSQQTAPPSSESYSVSQSQTINFTQLNLRQRAPGGGRGGGGGGGDPPTSRQQQQQQAQQQQQQQQQQAQQQQQQLLQQLRVQQLQQQQQQAAQQQQQQA